MERLWFTPHIESLIMRETDPHAQNLYFDYRLCVFRYLRRTAIRTRCRSCAPLHGCFFSPVGLLPTYPLPYPLRYAST